MYKYPIFERVKTHRTFIYIYGNHTAHFMTTSIIDQLIFITGVVAIGYQIRALVLNNRYKLKSYEIYVPSVYVSDKYEIRDIQSTNDHNKKVQEKSTSIFNSLIVSNLLFMVSLALSFYRSFIP